MPCRSERRALLAIALAIALAAALPGAIVPVSAATPAPTPVEIVIRAHRFVPAAITVPADQPFTLVVRNLDDTAEEFESPDLQLEKIVMPGKMLTFNLPGRRAGRYRFFGDFHQDTAQGLLTVR